MGDDAGFLAAERDRFQQCYSRLMSFVSQGDDLSRTNVNLLLDELNSIDYSSKIVKEEEANSLIRYKICSLVPLHDERLLVKVCQTVFNFTARQQLTLSDGTLLVVTEYLIGGAQRCQPWALSMILQALGAVVYENVGRLTKFHEILLGRRGILVPLIEGGAAEEDVLRQAVQTLENMTIKVPPQPYMEDRYALLCFEIFMKLLHKIPATKLDPTIQCKVLISSLRGLQNILSATKIMPSEQLGPLLAGVRASMFHGITAAPVVVPETLYPSPISNIEPDGKAPPSQLKPQSDDSTKGQSGKKSKKRKPKKGKEQDGKQAENDEGQDEVTLSSGIKEMSLEGQAQGQGEGASGLRPSWTKISSSESDYSDTEGGQSSRYRSTCAKVRQCALACLHTLVKNTDKKLMFGYWSSFIPDSITTGNSSHIQTLFTIILKDPSPKCRMGALATLTALLEGTKNYLAAAEDIDQMRTAFTPFSSVLGSTIHELHRCLLLALVSENFPLTLTQLIKCLSVLITNVPYQRMRPGLLSRVTKNVKNFLGHRDPNVRVACLTCFGAVSAIQPPLMEVCHIIQPSWTSSLTAITKEVVAANKPAESTDSGFVSNQSPDSGNLETVAMSTSPSSPSPTLSGIQTPVFPDPALQTQASQSSWLIKLCVRNITPQPRGFNEGSDYYVEPLPVRLESLQVLAHLTKGYFPIIRNSLPVLRDLICQCFEDGDNVIRLHTSKLLDELTQALNKDLQALDSSDGAQRLTRSEVHHFWDYILSGPVPKILQREVHNPVKAVTCDCLSNIGADVFSIISMDKRILCITLILGLTSDEDRVVRSSAVRTLGVYVLYNCLREDVNFVADAANAILTCMADSSLNVRLKTAWSLANLCDALVLNKDDGDVDFMEDFSDLLLQKLFTTATLACQDNDKVKSNAVRALGNIMRYLPTRSLAKIPFRTSVEDGVKALVKNISTGAMKVRWNACYAVSNLFRNNLLNHGNSPWIKDILLTLCTVVMDCKNFKVRINAALALGSPAERCHYGNQDLYLHIWESLIKGLKTAEEITDFAEFRYRDSLNDHICSAILHIILLSGKEDLMCLSDLLKKEDISVYFDRFKASTKHKDLPQALENMTKLSKEGMSPMETGVVNKLIDLCSVEDEEEKKPEKTSFKQTYD